jgi:predicted DNA-binding transcriptional regulator
MLEYRVMGKLVRRPANEAVKHGTPGTLPTEEELVDYMKSHNATMSVSELQYAFNVSPQKARGFLQKLVKKGTLKTAPGGNRGLLVYSLAENKEQDMESLIEHRVFGTLTESGPIPLSKLADQDEIDSFDMQWTSKRSRKYRAGSKETVYDRSGMHDAEVTVLSPNIIASADDPDMAWLAVQYADGTKGIESYNPRKDRFEAA